MGTWKVPMGLLTTAWVCFPTGFFNAEPRTYGFIEENAPTLFPDLCDTALV